VRHYRWLSTLLNRPQLIAPAAGAAVLAALRPDAMLDGYEGELADDAANPRRYQVVDGVAVVPVVGELVHRASYLDARSGLTNYQSLADMVAEALADGGIRGVLLDVDSWGGEADGCLDLAERWSAYRGLKPLIAVANAKAASAAYALAAACDRVLLGPDGRVGSIGVVAYHTDLSGALDQAGIKVTCLYAGAHKVDGTNSQPLSDQARNAFQRDIDAQYGRFVAVVAAARGLSEAAVRATEAAVLRGDDAISAGLADDATLIGCAGRFTTLEEVLAIMTERSAPSGARLAPATVPATGTGAEPAPPTASAAAPVTTAPAPVPEPPAAPLAIAAACAEAGFPGLTLGLLQRGAALSVVHQRIAEAKAIADAGERLRQPGLAQRLITEGVSEASARAILTEATASRDQAVVTDTSRAVAAPTAEPVLDHRGILARMNHLGLKGA